MLVSQGADRQKNTWTPIFLGWGLPSIIVLTLIRDHNNFLQMDKLSKIRQCVMISSNDNDVN